MSILENGFPLRSVSEACKKEKSIRQGHISTLQQWWARRPLGLARSSIFAALVPSYQQALKIKDLSKPITENLHTEEEYNNFVTRITEDLAKWESISNHELLTVANSLIQAGRKEAPVLLDSFAGGGSFPLEGLRLGVKALAGELNPVASTALKVAIEYLPNNDCVVKEFVSLTRLIESKLDASADVLYGNTKDKKALAFFWCKVYVCPGCGFEMPLLHDRWLQKGKIGILVDLVANKKKKNFSFKLVEVEKTNNLVTKGTVNQKGACCLNCEQKVNTKWLRSESVKGRFREYLYAKLIIHNGKKEYQIATDKDRERANNSSLSQSRLHRLKNVPNMAFDPNGIRHTWMMQYGITSTAKLYGHRQSIALLEVFSQIEYIKRDLLKNGRGENTTGLVILLTLTLNRLISYGNKHCWWQSNGGFPANIFTRQAIPLVWNFVEIPVNSPGAGGWKSASKWISKIAEHLSAINKKGEVWRGDAGSLPVGDKMVDLVTVDPPYFDSVAYSYLSDVYYVWMKELLGDLLVEDFATSLSPKENEAIVDRKHNLAPSPKTSSHFENKMLEAFREIRRVIKPKGKLILMYGHKKAEAWAAIIRPLLKEGFELNSSWPIQTERKSKFKHNYIDALGSSVMLVCSPTEEKEKEKVEWRDYLPNLNDLISTTILKFQTINLWGSDLFAALLAPSINHFWQYNVFENGELISLDDFLDRLPDIVYQNELKSLEDKKVFEKYPELKAITEHIARTKESWLSQRGKSALIDSIVSYSTYLNLGNAVDADRIWKSLSPEQKTLFVIFLRYASVSSAENTPEKKYANASLGRISHLSM